VKKKVIIGSRGSDLALWQANDARYQLEKIGLQTDIKIIKTKGDAIQNLSFDKMEGKGFFTKEIEDALLRKEIDLAVHSHKDLPTTGTPGLKISAVSKREDPSECLLILKDCVDTSQKFSLKENAIIGTSSPRRKSQLLSFRKDLIIQDLRGNVPTRVQKLRDKKYDAILIAYAGLKRLALDLSEFQMELISPRELIPAPAQGVLAYQIREEDNALAEYLIQLNDEQTDKRIKIERKVFNLFEGGCQLPLGVYCENGKHDYKVWIAKSEKWEVAPVRMFFEANNTKNLAGNIAERIKNIKPQKIFITRDLDDSNYFYDTLVSNGFEVTGKSLIAINPVKPNSLPDKIDWVFFSSKNGIKHFFDQFPDLKESGKYGVIGTGTEAALRSYGKMPDYVGSHSDTTKIGQEFSQKVGGNNVLFPCSKNGLRNIQT